MKVIRQTIFVLAAMAMATAAPAQDDSTNSAGTDSPTNIDPIIPLIQMNDVPIGTVIEHLARQAGINYLIIPELARIWRDSGEPALSIKWRDISAKDALEQVLSQRGLALTEDPVSNIALIIPANQTADPRFAGLTTNAAATHDNPVPLIQFADVPITTAIEHLARQAGENYIIAPEASQMWDGSGPHPVPEPLLTLRLENVTCWNTLRRLLNVYGLAIHEDFVTQVARIDFVDKSPPALDLSLLDMGGQTPMVTTNEIIPLIRYSDMPLEYILERLIKQAGLNADLDATVKLQNLQHHDVILSLRWENLTAKQAIFALCENYNLTIAQDEASGKIIIKPAEARKHHLLRH